MLCKSPRPSQYHAPYLYSAARHVRRYYAAAVQAAGQRLEAVQALLRPHPALGVKPDLGKPIEPTEPLGLYLDYAAWSGYTSPPNDTVITQSLRVVFAKATSAGRAVVGNWQELLNACR